MIEFFDRTLGYLEQFWNVVSNSFNAIFSALGYLQEALFSIMEVMGFMPVVIASCAYIVILFSVVKFVIGR